MDWSGESKSVVCMYCILPEGLGLCSLYSDYATGWASWGSYPGYGTHLPSSSVAAGVLSWGQISGDVMLTTHHCLVPRLRMSGTVPVFFLFSITSCTEITLPFTSYVFYLQSLLFYFCYTHDGSTYRLHRQWGCCSSISSYEGFSYFVWFWC